MMKIVSIIPARYDSTRFPGKLMQQLGERKKQRRFEDGFRFLKIRGPGNGLEFLCPKDASRATSRAQFSKLSGSSWQQGAPRQRQDDNVRVELSPSWANLSSR